MAEKLAEIFGARRKIKVVFGINDLGIGGAERLTVEYLKRIDQTRFGCYLITLRQNPEENFLAEVPSSVRTLHFDFKSLHDIRSWWRLYRALQALKPDIVVSNLTFSNNVFRILKLLLGYAVIPCEHNTYVKKTRTQLIADRWLARVSYRIVAVSKTVAEFTAAQEGIPKAKFVVIHNGVDIQKLQNTLAALPAKEELKSELGFKPANKLILTVGRLLPQKNQKLLLDGFALFHKKFPTYKLAIVGEGWLRPKLETRTNALDPTTPLCFLAHVVIS